MKAKRVECKVLHIPYSPSTTPDGKGYEGGLMRRAVCFSNEDELRARLLSDLPLLCGVAEVPPPVRAEAERCFQKPWPGGKPVRADIWIEHDDAVTVVEIKLIKTMSQAMGLIGQILVYRQLAELEHKNVNLVAVIDGRFYSFLDEIATRYETPIKWVLADGSGLCLLQR